MKRHYAKPLSYVLVGTLMLSLLLCGILPAQQAHASTQQVEDMRELQVTYEVGSVLLGIEAALVGATFGLLAALSGPIAPAVVAAGAAAVAGLAGLSATSNFAATHARESARTLQNARSYTESITGVAMTLDSNRDHDVPSPPLPDLEPGSVFNQYVELHSTLAQGLSQMDCPLVAATDQAGFRREAEPHCEDITAEAEFVLSCNNLRDTSSVILSDSKTVSDAIAQLQAISRFCQPDDHGKHDPKGTRDPVCDVVTDLLNQLDAVILAQGDHVDTLKNELIPAFSDPDEDGLPSTFDSEPGGGD